MEQGDHYEQQMGSGQALGRDPHQRDAEQQRQQERKRGERLEIRGHELAHLCCEGRAYSAGDNLGVEAESVGIQESGSGGDKEGSTV